MEVYIEEDIKCIHLIFSNKRTMKETLQHISWEREGIKENKNEIAYDAHNFPLKFFKKFIKISDIKDSDIKSSNIKLQKLLELDEDYYVIGYVKGDNIAKNHELCHAKYYRDEKYREKVKNMWDNLPKKKKEKIREILFRMGYREEFHLDEFQAYHYTNDFWGFKSD